MTVEQILRVALKGAAIETVGQCIVVTLMLNTLAFLDFFSYIHQRADDSLLIVHHAQTQVARRLRPLQQEHIVALGRGIADTLRQQLIERIQRHAVAFFEKLAAIQQHVEAIGAINQLIIVFALESANGHIGQGNNLADLGGFLSHSAVQTADGLG